MNKEQYEDRYQHDQKLERLKDKLYSAKYRLKTVNDMVYTYANVRADARVYRVRLPGGSVEADGWDILLVPGYLEEAMSDLKRDIEDIDKMIHGVARGDSHDK